MTSDGLVFNHIHHALDQVRELRARVIENQEFQGYSGFARVLGGSAAILCAAIMSTPTFPKEVEMHFLGWGLVCLIGILLNYGALGIWYRRQSERELLLLRPAIDALPPLVVGGICTAALYKYGAYDLLFIVWMCVYGLVNVSSRRSLPIAMWYVGLYYISCGALLVIFHPSIPFTNPWPMAIVFFVGELFAGYFLRRQERGRTSFELGVE